MKLGHHNLRLLVQTLVATAALWSVLTWPLPLHLFNGVATSSRNIEIGNTRAMMPSDQLQLEYHFWLVSDMIAGDTPWFHNVYEFNTGDDAERFWPYAYFVPFSLIYSAAAAIGGRAFGMNMAGLISLWFTVLFTVLLMRRFTDSTWVASCATVVAIAVPVRWAAQLGGSPGGYAMVYVPLVALGLDIAVRDRTWTGGLIAGIGILLVCWGDVQLFALMGLSMPFWCLLSWCGAEDRRFTLVPWIKSLAPLLPFVALAFGYRAILHSYLHRSSMSGGRAMEEVAAYSPHWTGLFSWSNGGIENHAYLGFSAVALLLFGVWRVRDRRRWPFYMLLAALLFIVLTALGPNGPVEGILFRGLRKIVPGFDMIRQPARVFGLLPTVLALAIAFVLNSAPRFRITLCLLSMVMVIEYTMQVRATVCVLDEEQGAYAAVAADAGERPHALVVPLWPGDADLASLYQYYASLYHIRMINGYSPVVARDYLENIYRRFESVNQGLLDDAQLDDLLERGIGHILLHEDQFPEKVSPFPVVTTLCRLLDHPRLTWLAQDESVWAFRIEPTPTHGDHPRHVLYSYFPARFREFEVQKELGEADVVGDPDASRGLALRLDRRGAWVKTKALRVGPAPRLRWQIRARGEGTLRAVQRADGAPFDHQALAVNSEDWQWQSIFLSSLPGFAPIELELFHEGGEVEVDVAYLTAGQWPPLRPEQSRTLPASAFFRAGYSDLQTGAVTMRRDYEPDGAILYGPLLPLEPGTYRLEMNIESGLVRDTRFGEVRVGSDPCFDVTSERKPVGEFRVGSDLPVRIEFVFNRAADLQILNIVLTLLEDEESLYRFVQ